MDYMMVVLFTVLDFGIFGLIFVGRDMIKEMQLDRKEEAMRREIEHELTTADNR